MRAFLSPGTPTLNSAGFREPDARDKRRVNKSPGGFLSPFGRRKPDAPTPPQRPGLDQSGRFIVIKHSQP